MKIEIKEQAAAMLDTKLEDNQFLRITVIEGGCAGLTYNAEIGKEMKDGESVVMKFNDVDIVSNSESIQYLDGLSIDYSDDLLNGGLQFTHSKTESTCSCGQSFNLAGFPVLNSGSCGK